MNLVENSLLSSLLFMVTSGLEEIQSSSNYVDTARGKTLERLEELLSNDPCKYGFYYILDDRIISSQC